MEQELGRVGGGDTHYETGFKNSKDTENFFINDSRCQKVTRSRRNCCKTTRLRTRLRRRQLKRQRRRRVDLIRGQTRGDIEFKVEDAIKTHSKCNIHVGIRKSSHSGRALLWAIELQQVAAEAVDLQNAVLPMMRGVTVVG